MPRIKIPSPVTDQELERLRREFGMGRPSKIVMLRGDEDHLRWFHGARCGYCRQITETLTECDHCGAPI